MRKLSLLAALATAVLAGSAAAAPGFVELFQRATAAHAAKDYAGMERALREAVKLRPGHPTATYKLAAALVLKGGGKDANSARDGLELLADLATQGLSFDAADDPDFAAVRETGRFERIAKAFARNARPAGEASGTFSVPAPGFIPDGIAYDDDRESFLLGSVRHRRIERIRAGGKREVFADKGLWSVLGLVVDEKRELLWVATAALPGMERAQAGELGRSAIVAFDLESGAEKHRYPLPDDGRSHVLNDLTVPSDGRIYATDSATGVLYELELSSGKYQALTEPGALSSPQGLVFSRGRGTLYVADRTQGLYRYSPSRRELKRMDVARDICVYGIDGLARHGDDLVAVQNGIRPHRIVRFRLDRNGRRVRNAQVLAASLKEFDEPTHGVVEGDTFHFVANGQFGRLGKDGVLPEGSGAGPIVMRVPLDPWYAEERRDGSGFPSQPAPAPSTGPPLGLPGIR